MTDFTDIDDVNLLLAEAQDAETDNRAKVKEVTYFVSKDDGQWEPEIISNMSGRPRYTFDKTNPVIDSIAGEMEQADFGIKVRPAGGDASKELAKLYDGMIRNIQSMSNAKHIFNAAGRKMVTAGFDVWRVVQGWSADGGAFDQDLLIKKIANAVDRVWFDPGAEMQDMSDANYCFVLQALTKLEYNNKFPEGSGASIKNPTTNEVYFYKAEYIVVGEFLYKKEVTKEFVLMSNQAVYEVDDKFEQVVDELAEQGITEVRRREKVTHVVMTRLFDGEDWLKPAEKTVFDLVPVIPTYGNFDIVEDKIIYRGAVNKLMDAQRVYNYAQSRATEEGALAPRAKYWMTRKQAEADMASLQTMNTNADPVQFYTFIEGQPPPYWAGGAQINAGLQTTANDMKNNIVEGSGIFAANQGNAPLQSGIAIERQQDKGDTSTIKYFSSQEIAICHTYRIIANAIPRAYDAKRVVRVLGEDGTSKMETINDQVLDADTQKMVPLNDLSKGKYDITCEVGPAFKNRQQETTKAFIDVAQLDPTIIEDGKDIWLGNLAAPGMDLMAERARRDMLKAGRIPDSQMTDDEKEFMQQLIAQAEEDVANQQPTAMDQAILEQTQANTFDIQSRAEDRANKLALAANRQQFDEAKFAAQINQDQNKLIMDNQKMIVDSLNTQADTLTKLVTALGVDGLVGPHTLQAGAQQAEIVTEEQSQMSIGLETANIGRT